MPVSDYNRLCDQLNVIQRDISGVKVDVAAIKAGFQQCDKSVSDLERTVYGNGNDGLKSTAQKQAGEITAIRTEIRRDRRWIGKIAVVVGWLVTACCLVYQTFAAK